MVGRVSGSVNDGHSVVQFSWEGPQTSVVTPNAHSVGIDLMSLQGEGVISIRLSQNSFSCLSSKCCVVRSKALRSSRIETFWTAGRQLSGRCKMVAERQCVVCGTPFVPHKPNRKYCKPVCRTIDWRIRKEAKRRAALDLKAKKTVPRAPKVPTRPTRKSQPSPQGSRKKK